MAVIVELPNSESAVLKDDHELTNREIKTMQRASRIAAAAAVKLTDSGFKEDDPESWRLLAEMPEGDYDAIDNFQRTCVFIRLKSWTLDRPLPQNADEVDDLPMNMYTPLTVAAVNLDFDEKFGVEGTSDPKALTENSAN